MSRRLRKQQRLNWLFTVLFLFPTCFSFAQSPAVLTAHLEAVRQGSYAAVPQAVLADTTNAAALLSTLATYQNDTLTALRSRAYNIAKRIGQRSSNPTVRQIATAQLTRGIADPEAGISGNNSAALTGFRSADFSAATQTQLLNYLQPSTPHLVQVAMLTGFASGKSAQSALQSLLTAKGSATTRWAIRLALARTSDALTRSDPPEAVARLGIGSRAGSVRRHLGPGVVRRDV